MARYEIERPQYVIHPGRGHVRIDGLSPENHSAVAVLDALSRHRRSIGDDTMVSGMLNADVADKGQLYDPGTVIIQTEGRDDMAEYIDDWLQHYYSGMHAQLQLSTNALGRRLRNRTLKRTK